MRPGIPPSPDMPEIRMDRETNIHSIRALEEQIRNSEHESAAVKLKRVRNSLLNVSKLPPEVLGNIFRWNVSFKGHFDGLDEGSHNFLLVCHHWFGVASSTPGLWSFWGNTLKDWGRWCHRSRIAPLDLILDDCHQNNGRFGTTLRNVLQDRAARDTIRRVHLKTEDSDLLSSIIAPLASSCEELRPNGIKSLILRNQGDGPVDISNFFAHYRFPKLRHLSLSNCAISSWDHLGSRTFVLTTLNLHFTYPSPIPTTSQILSILASNPALRKVALDGRAAPGDGGDKTSFRVQLPHLKDLKLVGRLRHAVGLLYQLDHPRDMDVLSLTLYDADIADISQIIGPYLRDHLQRRDRPRNGLVLSALSRRTAEPDRSRLIFLANTGGTNFSTLALGRMDMFAEICVLLNGTISESVLDRAVLDLITYAPPEEVVYLQTCCNPAAMEDTRAQFPSLRALSLESISLPAAFPNPKLIADGKVFPSLEHILLNKLIVDDGDWGPLVAFLDCRMSSGNPLHTLVITHSNHMCPEVTESITGMVWKFATASLSPVCPFGTCPQP